LHLNPWNQAQMNIKIKGLIHPRATKQYSSRQPLYWHGRMLCRSARL